MTAGGPRASTVVPGPPPPTVIPAKQAVSILCFVATKPQSVIPAKAGIQGWWWGGSIAAAPPRLDSRFRGNDGWGGTGNDGRGGRGMTRLGGRE